MTSTWELIATPTPHAKRIVAVCSSCGAVMMFGAEAFAAAQIAPCSCSRLAAHRAAKIKSFAENLAGAERHAAPSRHRGGGQ